MSRIVARDEAPVSFVACATEQRDERLHESLAAWRRRIAEDRTFALEAFAHATEHGIGRSSRAEAATSLDKGSRSPGLVSELPAEPARLPSNARRSRNESPEVSPPVRALALDLRRHVEGSGLTAYRLSKSFAAPTLEAARAALARGADAASALGPGRGLLGAVDRRSAPNAAGRDCHLYLLVVADSLAEACAVRDAASHGLASSRRGEKLDALGFGGPATEQDYESCVAYLLKSAEPARAAGSLGSIWEQHRAGVVASTSGAGKACGHCGAALRPDHPQRRTRPGADGSPVAGYCSKPCRQKACRREKARRKATGATDGSLRRAPATSDSCTEQASRAATDTKPATAVLSQGDGAELVQVLVEALDFEGDDAPWSTLRETALRELASRGLQEPAGGALLMALPKARRERAGAQPC